MKKTILLLIFASQILSGFSQNNNYRPLLDLNNSRILFEDKQFPKSNFDIEFSGLRGLESKDTTYVKYPKKFVDKEACTNSDNAKLYPWGLNLYQESEKGQLYYIDYTQYDSAKINALWAALFVYKNASAAASVKAQVYAFDTAQGFPTTLLGTSNPVLLSTIKSNPLQNFSFATPVSIPASGFVMVTVTAPTTAGDSIILYSTPPACSASKFTAWDCFKSGAGNDWMPITWSWRTHPDSLNGPSVYFHIFPEISMFSSVEVKSSKKEILTFDFNALTPPVKGVVWDSLVTLEVPYGTSLTDLVATFTVKDSATLSVGGTEQMSGQTPNSFESPVSYVLKAQDGSTKTYIVTVDVLAGIKNQSLSNLILAPNPIKNRLNVNFNSSESLVVLKLLSLTGDVIYEEVINKTNGSFKTSVELNDYTPGIYFLQLNTKEGMVVKKVIKN